MFNIPFHIAVSQKMHVSVLQPVNIPLSVQDESVKVTVNYLYIYFSFFVVVLMSTYFQLVASICNKVFHSKQFHFILI